MMGINKKNIGSYTMRLSDRDKNIYQRYQSYKYTEGVKLTHTLRATSLIQILEAPILF